tara:strand:- start:13741 stop:15912 length:2172 start_codon:yes stop_codon:yes gene_type:complete
LVKFKIAGRGIDYFGKEAIGDDYTALFELVKNARDACAKHVDIIFENNQIIIEDDGDGMTEADIENNWFVLATDSRLKRTKTNCHGKQVWGEKGIGRIALQKLGDKAVMKTLAKGGSQTVIVHHDWQKFNKEGVTFDDVDFPIEVRSKGKDTKGTTLEISNLNSRWPTTRRAELQTELGMMISAEDFNDIKITVDGTIVGLETREFRKKVSQIAPYKISASISSNGVTTKIADVWKNQGNWQPGKTMDGDYGDGTYPGKMRVEFYFFPRGAAKQETAKVEKYYKQKLKNASFDLNNFSKENSGVYLFRDGVWARPLGGQDDWLGMEARRVQNPTGNIGRTQVFGVVNVTKKNNPDIKPSSHRESMQKSKEFIGMKKVLIQILKVLEAYWREVKAEDKKETLSGYKDRGEKTEKQLKDAIKIIKANEKTLGKTTAGSVTRMLKDATEGFEETKQEYEDRLGEVERIDDHIKKVASLGIMTSYMAHEIANPLEQSIKIIKNARKMMDETDFDEKIPKAQVEEGWEMVEGLEKNAATMSKFTEMVNKLNKHIATSVSKKGRARDVNIFDLWEKVSEGFSSIKEKYQISIIDPSNTKLTVRMDPIDLECIFANLYLNSIESLALDKKNSKKTVSVETKWDSSGLTIDFKDNGIGILAEEKDNIFEDFVTGDTSSDDDDYHGQGIGLSICNALIERYNGSIKAVPPYGEGAGARFILHFSSDKVSKVA